MELTLCIPARCLAVPTPPIQETGRMEYAYFDYEDCNCPEHSVKIFHKDNRLFIIC